MTNAANKRAHENEYDLDEELEKIKNVFTEAVQSVKERAGEVLSGSINGAKEKTAEVQETVSEYVNEKPIKSLGIAVLAGLVIGYFLNSRN